MNIGTSQLLWRASPIFLWLCTLIHTDSYFSVYIFLGLFSLITILKTPKKGVSNSVLDYLFPFFLSLCVTLANYPIYNEHRTLFMIILFISGFFVFFNIFRYVKINIRKTIKTKKNKDSLKLSIICFSVIFLLNTFVLITCCYPGVLASDSIDEIGQIFSGNYNNHHPVYFTFLIKAFVSLGLSVFNDINIGIMFYSLFQIIILAATFSYAVYTLCQIGTPKKIIIPLIIFTALMPYNIMYSFTLWKDILFGASMLVLIVTLYRFFHNLNKNKIIPIILIILSGLIICLFRSNGLIAFFVSDIVFFIIFRKKYFKLGILLCCIAISAFILKSPVLKALEIKQPDTVESLSIPMQQITRVLVEDKNSLSQEDISRINNVANVDRLIESYNPILHDPIKIVVRREGNQKYLQEHLPEYAMLYIRIGVQHPIIYTKAWINQTRGYWNGGYSYWKWTDELSENNYGIKRTVNLNLANSLRKKYLDSFNVLPFLNPFISIGLFVWILLLLLYKAILAKNSQLLFLLTPLITTWATLLIATPVFSEFRYVYFIFTCIPFLIIASQTNITTRRQ